MASDNTLLVCQVSGCVESIAPPRYEPRRCVASSVADGLYGVQMVESPRHGLDRSGSNRAGWAVWRLPRPRTRLARVSLIVGLDLLLLAGVVGASILMGGTGLKFAVGPLLVAWVVAVSLLEMNHAALDKSRLRKILGVTGIIAPLLGAIVAILLTQALLLDHRGVVRTAVVAAVHNNEARLTTAAGLPIPGVVNVGDDYGLGDQVVILMDPGGVVDPELYPGSTASDRAHLALALIVTVGLGLVGGVGSALYADSEPAPQSRRPAA
jgi:hypothetical protein